MAFARTRHGVITTAQLSAFGLGTDAVSKRARAGRLFRHYRGVYSVGRPDLPPAGRRLAAVLACGPNAVLSHRSAAAQHGLLQDNREMPDVTIPGRARRPRHGIHVHSSRTLTALDIATVGGIPSTSVARTLVDIGDREPERLVERAVDQAEVLGVFDLAAVEEVLQRAGPKRGAGVLARVLAQHQGPTLTDRELEERFLALIRGAGLSAPEVNAWVMAGSVPYKADFLWRAEQLVAETDGRAFHTSRKAFEHDRLRDQRLTLAGFAVVRFTWRQVTREPQAVAATVAALLGQERPVARLAHP